MANIMEDAKRQEEEAAKRKAFLLEVMRDPSKGSPDDLQEIIRDNFARVNSNIAVTSNIIKTLMPQIEAREASQIVDSFYNNTINNVNSIRDSILSEDDPITDTEKAKRLYLSSMIAQFNTQLRKDFDDDKKESIAQLVTDVPINGQIYFSFDGRGMRVEHTQKSSIKVSNEAMFAREMEDAGYTNIYVTKRSLDDKLITKLYQEGKIPASAQQYIDVVTKDDLKIK